MARSRSHAGVFLVCSLAATVAICATAHSQTLTTTSVATGLTKPIQVAFAPGDETRLFVIEQRGIVKPSGGRVQFEDRFDQDLDSGYVAVHAAVMLKTPSGCMIQSEVQFHMKAIHDGSARSVNEQAHKPYKVAQKVGTDKSLAIKASQGMMLMYATALHSASRETK